MRRRRRRFASLQGEVEALYQNTDVATFTGMIMYLTVTMKTNLPI